jgi:DNA (cytosine-5)-methyltransferase 1
MERTITTIDLFCGAGGMTEGFRQAGFTCLLAIDHDPQAIKTFAFNHPTVPCLTQDLKEVTAADICAMAKNSITNLDILSGGPPCQGFSLAGQRIGDDPRNKLFLDFVRVANYFRPKFVVFENVSGIMSMQNGAVQHAIITEFKRIGYSCHSALLNAADYGVPQFRKRYILIASRDKIGIGFPSPTHGINNHASGNLFTDAFPTLLPYVTVWEALSDLPSIEAGDGAEEISRYNPATNPYQEARRGEKSPNALFNHRAIAHSDTVKHRYALIVEGETNASLPEELRTKKRNVFKLHRHRPSPTVTCNHRTDLLHPVIPRGTTVREAARLQSFDDDYCFFGNLTRKAKYVTQDDQVGNAVPPLLARAIGLHLKASLC